MKTAEFTHYQFMATLDRRTCVRCGERDGEVYKLSEMNQGENAPPLHARCRCTIVAYDGVGNGQRVAGRERLPEGVTYKQWRSRLEIPKHETDEQTLTPRTLEEAKAVANNFNSVVGKYFVRKSKWSGQVTIGTRGRNSKNPNCSIEINPKDCPDEAILHELVHAHSTSYYPNKIYIANSAIEEASVQYLTQEIAKREGIILSGSVYDYWLDVLREVNRKFGLYETDLKFAQKLLRVPMTNRLDWLSKKVLKTMGNGTFEQLSDMTALLNKLTWEAIDNDL